MIDNWSRFEAMREEKLHAEIRSMTSKIVNLSPGSSLYQQVLGILSTAQEVLQEKMIMKQVSSLKDEVVDIGEVEEVIVIPDYSKDELLQAMVDLYTKDKNT